MVKKYSFDDLVSLVKVFDANYVTDEDCEELSGVDVNQEQGVVEVVRRLLLPEFARYTESAQATLLSSLRSAVTDPEEDFSRLFDRVEFAFDAPVKDRKGFMQTLLRSIEARGG